jgi:hypothetical protein
LIWEPIHERGISCFLPMFVLCKLPSPFSSWFPSSCAFSHGSLPSYLVVFSLIELARYIPLYTLPLHPLPFIILLFIVIPVPSNLFLSISFPISCSSRSYSSRSSSISSGLAFRPANVIQVTAWSLSPTPYSALSPLMCAHPHLSWAAVYSAKW